MLADAEASELLHAVRASSIVMEDTTSNVLSLRHKGLPWKFSAMAREPIDIRTIFADSLEVTMTVFSPASARCPVTYEALPQPLLGDAEALRRLFSNLVVSACHLHISGGQAAHVGSTAITRIPASESGCRDGDGTVGVDVTLSLSLPALPDTALSSIFNPCEGVCCTALFVARAIARAMGGDVEVANGPDHVRISARFWLHQEGAEPVGGAGVQGEPSLGESLAAIEEVCMKRAPPLTELTTRMMECMAGASQQRRTCGGSSHLTNSLTATSDHVFHQGDLTPNGSLSHFTWVSAGMTRHFKWSKSVVGTSPIAVRARSAAARVSARCFSHSYPPIRSSSTRTTCRAMSAP